MLLPFRHPKNWRPQNFLTGTTLSTQHGETALLAMVGHTEDNCDYPMARDFEQVFKLIASEMTTEELKETVLPIAAACNCCMCAS